MTAVRAKSKQWSKGALPAWYAKKTAVRRVVNLIPKNAKLASVLATVEEVEAGEFTVLPPDRDPDGPTPAQIAAASGDLRGNGQSRFPLPVQHGDYPPVAETPDAFDPETGELR